MRTEFQAKGKPCAQKNLGVKCLFLHMSFDFRKSGCSSFNSVTPHGARAVILAN